MAAKGGTVAAFEMGPPIDMLRINKRYGISYIIWVVRDMGPPIDILVVNKRYGTSYIQTYG